MDIDFFGGSAPDPAQDPQGYNRAQRVAQALMQQGQQSPQGQMVNGRYVPPSPLGYVGQIGSAMAGGKIAGSLAEAQRASTILNGGTVSPPPIQRIGSWLGSLFGGAAGGGGNGG